MQYKLYHLIASTKINIILNFHYFNHIMEDELNFTNNDKKNQINNIDFWSISAKIKFVNHVCEKFLFFARPFFILKDYNEAIRHLKSFCFKHKW